MRTLPNFTPSTSHLYQTCQAMRLRLTDAEMVEAMFNLRESLMCLYSPNDMQCRRTLTAMLAIVDEHAKQADAAACQTLAESN